MKRGTSNSFFRINADVFSPQHKNKSFCIRLIENVRIIATLLVLTSLQSCDVCLGLLDFGLEMLDDWYYYQQCDSGRGQTYNSSGGGRTYKQSYRSTYKPAYQPNRGKNKNIQEEEIQEERIKTRKEKCDVCNGTGSVEWAPEFYMSGNRCKICQKKKDVTHRHPIKCKNCDGEGFIRIPIDESGK